MHTFPGDSLLSQIFLGVDKYSIKKTYHFALKNQFLSIYSSWISNEIIASKRLILAKQSLFGIVSGLIDNVIITRNIIKQWAKLDPDLVKFGAEAELWTEIIRDWYKQQVLEAIYSPRNTFDPVHAVHTVLTSRLSIPLSASISLSSRGKLKTFLRNNPIVLTTPLFTEIDAINVLETLQFTYRHLTKNEFLHYREKYNKLLTIDSVWSELKYPIVETFKNLYEIVSEYEGKLDKVTCRFYRVSSSGISNEDFLNKYIHTEETETVGKTLNKKFFFEIDLTSQDSIQSGIISAIYYMAKFNSLLTITEGSQPTNMAPYVLIASLDKIYDKEYLSTLTKGELKVAFGSIASGSYNNWKAFWNKDDRDNVLWARDNMYPLHLFNDVDLLKLDNILKDKFVRLFASTGMTSVRIYNLLGLRYEV